MWSWALSALGSGAQGVHHVQALPRQVQIVAAKVAVGGHLLVDGALEVEAADDGRRGHRPAAAAVLFEAPGGGGDLIWQPLDLLQVFGTFILDKRAIYHSNYISAQPMDFQNRPC